MGVAGLHLVEAGKRIALARCIADAQPCRHPERTQHDHQRTRDLLAKADPLVEQEMIDRIGIGRQRGYIHRIRRVRSEPTLDRFHLAEQCRGAIGNRRSQIRDARRHVGRKLRIRRCSRFAETG